MQREDTPKHKHIPEDDNGEEEDDDEDDELTLLDAAEAGLLEEAKQFIAKGADVNIKSKEDDNFTPLHCTYRAS